ncbi:MAG: hypothetical protein ACI8UX_001617 [Psychromonas sp.]
MKIRVLRLLLIFLSTILNVKAQVSIDLPVSNSVFQRSAGDETDLYIAGSYLNPIVTSVQARLVAPSTLTPVSGFDWTIIESNPSKGKYFGQLSTVPTGWYILEVRLVNTGNVLSSSFVSRVGVGDVYLAFGQSNAQGLPESGEVGAVFEKVISHNYIDSCSQKTPSFPSLSKIITESNVGQHGLGSWIYGRLGDNLVTENDVPVAFFNAATSGADLYNFLQSSIGSSTIHPFTGEQFCTGINPSFPSGVGSPYEVFRKTIHFYNSIYGIRAILWHQGESETFLNTLLSNCYNRLDSLINYTRADFGKNINWLVSRASYINGATWANIITAQDSIIDTANKVFAGPFTDNVIGVDKRDVAQDVHFINSGLIDVANKWSDAMVSDIYTGNTESFYDLSVPYESNAIPEIETSISGNSVSLTAPLGYTSYKWVNGDNFDSPVMDNDRFYTATSGTVRCYMTLANNNMVFSPAVNISNLLSQQSISTAYVDSLYLSDYTPYSISNGLGPVSFNQSVGSSGDGDGSLMEINGISYPRGIGTHSDSELIYKMKTGFSSRLKASIGIDDDSFSGAGVKFKVYGEDTLIYTSSILTHASNTVNIDVNIAGYSSIKLVVENSGGTVAANQANWANARIIYDKPKDLTLSLLSTKCLELNWTAANDLNGIVSYKLYKNDTLQATIPTGILTYKFDSLSRNISYTLSVKAVDANGFETAKIDTIVSTLFPSITYNSNNEICIGDNVIPTLIPSGGVFKLVDKPESVNMTFNLATGELNFSTEGFILIRYIWEDGTSCKDSAQTYVGGIVKPTEPSISTSTNTLINTGQHVSFNSTPCVSPYVLEWQDTSMASSLMTSPSDTSSYFAFCKNYYCYSNPSNVIMVSVIPDCPKSFTLVSSVNDINYGSSSFNFFASNTINATNQIINPSSAFFKAGQAITLNPGFEIKAGSVFSATIEGCP